VKRLARARELLDGELDPDLLRGNLDDLTRVNRWLGGWVLSRRAIVSLLARGPGHSAPVELLDVGTGAADIPAALASWFAARGLAMHVTACDARVEIVDEARRRTAEVRGIEVELVPEHALPYADRAFDIAHVSMVLHHREGADATAMLRELARVSRLGVVVNDLDRTFRFWIGAMVLAGVTTTNRYTRSDGPMSVRRAWRVPEAEGMAAEAGLQPVARFRHPFGYRYAIAFEHVRNS
jgi:ubiquinone/menaquinone biosynthesis C-methylase UbiE